MAFLDRIVSDVIKKSTGFNARPFVRAVGGKNLLLLGGAAVAGALAVDKMRSSDPKQQPSGGATPPLPPPSGELPPLPPQELPPLPGAGPQAAPTTQSEEPPRELVYAIVRTMVAAALADGEVHDDEKKLIEKRLGESGLSAEQIGQIRKDLVIPASPETLAGLTSTAEDKEMLLRFASLVVLSDDAVTDPEKVWLDKFSDALAIDEERARSIQTEIFEAN